MKRIARYGCILATSSLWAGQAVGTGRKHRKLDTGDTAWMLASAALVLFMTPGLALFYGGMTRQKNILSTIMHSFFIMGIVSVQWVLVGYTLAFGPDIGRRARRSRPSLPQRGRAGTESLRSDDSVPCLHDVPGHVRHDHAGADHPARSPSGCGSAPFVVFTLLWATLVYDPLAHWVWGGGWLGSGKLGALDFAGGTVVHISSGIAALAAALVLGRRLG